MNTSSEKEAQDLAKAISKLLNVLFHDERNQGNNLLMLLRLHADKEENIPPEIIEAMVVIIQSLNSRIEIDKVSNPYFYRLREYFDGLSSTDVVKRIKLDSKTLET